MPPSQNSSWEASLRRISEVEKLGFIESQTEAWYHARRGRITASARSAVIAKRSPSSWTSMANDIRAELSSSWARKTFDNTAMKWGRDHEKQAIANLELEFGEETTDPGFILHPNHYYAGATPDAFLGHRSVQIKCPWQQENHLRFIYEPQLPDQYYYQVQFEAFVAGLPKIVFCSYDPRQVLAQRIAIIELDANKTLWQTFDEHLAAFKDFFESGTVAPKFVGTTNGLPQLF